MGRFGKSAGAPAARRESGRRRQAPPVAEGWGGPGLGLAPAHCLCDLGWVPLLRASVPSEPGSAWDVGSREAGDSQVRGDPWGRGMHPRDRVEVSERPRR